MEMNSDIVMTTSAKYIGIVIGIVIGMGICIYHSDKNQEVHVMFG